MAKKKKYFKKKNHGHNLNTGRDVLMLEIIITNGGIARVYEDRRKKKPKHKKREED